MAPALIAWLTRGVHFGVDRSYLAVHIDDVLLPNARWLPDVNCAVGADCPDTVGPLPLIRMTPDDVAYAVEWQRSRGAIDAFKCSPPPPPQKTKCTELLG